ncbi:MAG: Holliday junction branch migration protein RuvA [Candidatus Portnoybacteria bacterium]|nr:Holliday junction branch migration protein RuvA [Candidatus Portnoybacteria bacterium]
MIALLQGKIELKTDKFVILNVKGVGYKIHCTVATIKKIKDEENKFFIHLYPRENILDLYGFLSFEELEFFEMLISISGIGPKAGLAILSIASLEDLKTSIGSGQVSLLSKVSGIGKKTAERVILELRGKILVSGDKVKQLISDDEAIDALISLGYTGRQAGEALKKVPVKVKKIEDRVKEALRILGK